MSPSTHIIVVGGGIVAASTAYHLARQEVGVTVVEGDQPGAATAAGAGIIGPWTSERPCYQLATEGARYYPELLAMLAGDGQADTGYAKTGALYVTPDAGALPGVAARLRSRRAGAPEIGEVTELGPGEPARMFPPLARELAGLWISGGARVDGRAITGSLLRAAAGRGARRIRGNAVLESSGGRVTGVRAGAGLVSADAVVVAAGAWTPQVCAGLGGPLPVRPQRGQILHTELPGADTAGWPVILPSPDPYLLAFPGGRVVLGATREDAGFDYRATAGGIGGLLAAGLRLAPGLRDATLIETRIGFRPATGDGCPLLGQLADGLFVAAGHGAEGLTAGPWTGLAAARLVLGEPPVTDLTPLDPARFQRTGPAG